MTSNKFVLDLGSWTSPSTSATWKWSTWR